MFAERFDALMNIAGVSNSMLGRAVSMDSSYIGRLRSGARNLPKKQDYLGQMCRYLAGHITKEYQKNALYKLTGIGDAVLNSNESAALYLENWLLQNQNTNVATGRLISGFSHAYANCAPLPPDMGAEMPLPKYSMCLYGNPGKRKAVEQFFLKILQEEEPQTLLLFSDENMAWMYEDTAFSVRWAELFKKVLMKGNRVRIIHTLSRDINELLEAVTKWIPIYMTGAIEAYYYPRLRDGVFQRTLFIAPNTAAVVSSSVQQSTDGMLNLFLTDQAAVAALVAEYEKYFSLCRPLMQIFTGKRFDECYKKISSLSLAEGNARIRCDIPPLFAMPEALAKELAEQTRSADFLSMWKQSVTVFRENIKNQQLHLSVLAPDIAVRNLPALMLPIAELLSTKGLVYTPDQYMRHFDHLKTISKQYRNITLSIEKKTADNTLLYVKEDIGVVMAKTDPPLAAFATNEPNIVNAFWEYMNRHN